MSQLTLFAIAPSRLHADLAVARLQRSTGYTDLISLIYPPSTPPNSVGCYFSNQHFTTNDSGRAVEVAGFLSSTFSADVRDFCNPFESAMLALGLSREHRLLIQNASRDRCTVVAVAITSLPEFLRVCKIFKNSGLEHAFTTNVEIPAEAFHFASPQAA